MQQHNTMATARLLTTAPAPALSTAPTEPQLAAINRVSLIEHDAEAVEVRSLYVAAGNATRAEDLASELPGRAIWVNGQAVGRWFEATPVRRPQGRRQGRARMVRAACYVDRTPRVAALLAAVDTGEASLELSPPVHKDATLDARLQALLPS